MAKKTIFGTLAMVLALSFGLVLAGCKTDDDTNGGDTPPSGGDKTVTFTLAKVDANTFTITVDGADWKESTDGSGALLTNSSSEDNKSQAVHYVLDFSGATVTKYQGLSSISNYDAGSNYFTYSISGKVITATLIPPPGEMSNAVGFSDLSGTIKGKSTINEYNGACLVTNGGDGIGPTAGGTTTYVVKPDAGITFGGGDNNNGYTGEGATPESFNVSARGIQYSIQIRTVENFAAAITDTGAGSQTRLGFTVKVNGTSQTITEAYSESGRGRAYVCFGDGSSLTGTETVTLTYDGTGAFAGKLKIFTDKAVPWDNH